MTWFIWQNYIMSKKLFSSKKRKEKIIPSHIVILPDGNRRWAKEKGLPIIKGHLEGFENLKKFCNWSYDKGIKVITTFGFSAENWNRPKQEVKYLLKLLERGLSEEIKKYHQTKERTWLFSQNVKVRIIGQKKKLPLRLQKVIKRVENLTKDNKDCVLNLAISYSGRWDVLQAIRKIIKEKISPKKITETLFNKYLSTNNLPAPDLIIRTGKERRLSNFLLYQAAYSELYFSDKYWPDFSEKDFNQALKEYKQRQRRFGK